MSRRALPLLLVAVCASAVRAHHARASSPALDEAKGAGDEVPPAAETPAPDSFAGLARPSPLAPDEEASDAAAALARRFNPGMAFTTRDIWPVEVRYAFHDGADLVARVVGDDGRTLREYVALPHARLAENDWGDLPDRDEEGHRIDYFIDAPGDDRVEQGLTGWVRRWRSIMGGDARAHQSPAALDYAPTQYAHLFWLDREKGLLAIQYWFYFPYNDWINHHEGDWEHINVILRGPSRLRSDVGYHPVGYQFFFHTFLHEPREVLRVAGADAREDHVMVYTGGQTRLLMWSGTQSGGSYPLPALYPGAGGGLAGLKPSDDTSRPARYVRPEDFRIILLPEPERLDVGQRPDLAWLRLSFFAGQTRVYRNPLSLNGAVFGSVPRQPSRQEAWNGAWFPPLWAGEPELDRRALALPQGWIARVDAPPASSDTLAARRGTVARPPRPRRH